MMVTCCLESFVIKDDFLCLPADGLICSQPRTRRSELVLTDTTSLYLQVCVCAATTTPTPPTSQEACELPPAVLTVSVALVLCFKLSVKHTHTHKKNQCRMASLYGPWPFCFTHFLSTCNWSLRRQEQSIKREKSYNILVLISNVILQQTHEETEPVQSAVN